MPSFRFLSELDVRRVLTMEDLIEAMADALARFSAGTVTQPVRTVVPVTRSPHHQIAQPPTHDLSACPNQSAANIAGPVDPRVAESPDGFFALMPAHIVGSALGAKLVTVFERNADRGLPTHLAIVALLDPDTGALRALLDGRYITEARTAAVSAVSTRWMARQDASVLAIIGSGVQARSHLDALRRVRSFASIRVWSPQRAHRERFVRDHADVAGLVACETAANACRGADVIALVTSSSTPVVEAEWVQPGCHVISVGAYRPTMREMDPALLAAGRLVVDSREGALAESGDVVQGIAEGRFAADHIAGELGDVVAGRVAGRTRPAEITIFKSLGLAVEDVAAADLAWRRAEELGIGAVLEL